MLLRLVLLVGAISSALVLLHDVDAATVAVKDDAAVAVAVAVAVGDGVGAADRRGAVVAVSRKRRFGAAEAGVGGAASGRRSLENGLGHQVGEDLGLHELVPEGDRRKRAGA